MKQKDIVVGILLLVIVAGLIFYKQKTSKPQEEMKLPETLSVEKAIEEKFKLEIPEDVDKAEMKDVSGGTSQAIATRKFEAGRFTLTILADLPDPQRGEFYQGWLIKGKEGEAGFSRISLGKLTLSKGGWILDYKKDSDLRDYSKVQVSLEKVFNSTPEKLILEGSF